MVPIEVLQEDAVLELPKPMKAGMLHQPLKILEEMKTMMMDTAAASFFTLGLHHNVPQQRPPAT